MRSIVDSMKIALVRGPNVFKFSFVLTCTLLLACPSAFALNPSLDVSQYAHTSWKIREGFLKGQISSIAQTSDGYLWLGTEFGLVRFDGVRIVPWKPPADQHLPSSHIMSLLVARDGTLWIGTEKGLSSWKDGKLTQYPQLDKHYIFKLLEDHEGSVWASGLPIANVNGRICAIRNGSVQCYGEDGAFGRGAFTLYEDSRGNLWAGVNAGVWRWKPGPPKFYPLPSEPDGIQCLGEDDEGVLLVGSQGALRRLVNGRTEAYPLPGAGTAQFRARRLLRDREVAYGSELLTEACYTYTPGGQMRFRHPTVSPTTPPTLLLRIEKAIFGYLLPTAWIGFATLLLRRLLVNKAVKL